MRAGAAGTWAPAVPPRYVKKKKKKNSTKQETTLMLFDREIDKLIQPYSGIIFIEKELTIVQHE